MRVTSFYTEDYLALVFQALLDLSLAIKLWTILELGRLQPILLSYVVYRGGK